MAKHVGLVLLLAASMLLASCTSSPGPESDVSKPSFIRPPSESCSEPSSGAAPAVSEEEMRLNLKKRLDRFLRPDWFLPAATRFALEEFGVAASVGEGRVVDGTHFAAVMTMSDSSGSVSFPIQAQMLYRDDGTYDVAWGKVSTGEGWFSVTDTQTLSVYRLGKLDKAPLELDVSFLAGTKYALLGAAHLPKMGWVVPVHMVEKDAVIFFREDGSLEEMAELSHDDLFQNNPWSGESHRGMTHRYPDLILPLKKDEDYVWLKSGYEYFLFSRQKKEAYRFFEQVNEKRDGKKVSIYTCGYSNHAVPDPDHTLFCLWEELGQKPAYAFGNVELLHPFFGYQVEETVCTWETERRFTALGEVTRAQVSADFNAGTVDIQYLIRLEDLIEKNRWEPDHISPSGRYALVPAGLAGGGDAAYYSLVLLDTMTSRIDYVTLCGGTYGYDGMVVHFLDDSIFWMHNFCGVRVYRTDGAEPLPFPIDLGLKEDELLFGFGHDPETGRCVSLYGNRMDRRDEETYRLAIFDYDGERIVDFDTGLLVQDTRGGPTRYDLTLEDNVVGFCGDSKILFDWAAKEYFTCRIFWDTQTVERTPYTE